MTVDTENMQEKNIILLNLSTDKSNITYYNYCEEGRKWGFSTVNSSASGTELIIKRLHEEGKHVDRIIAMHTPEAWNSFLQFRYEIQNFLQADNADEKLPENIKIKAGIEKRLDDILSDKMRQHIMNVVSKNDSDNIKDIQDKLKEAYSEKDNAEELKKELEDNNKNATIRDYIRKCNYEKLSHRGDIENVEYVDVIEQPEIIPIEISGGVKSNKEIDSDTIAEVLEKLSMENKYKVNVYIDTQGGSRVVVNMLNAIVTMTDYSAQSGSNYGPIRYRNRYAVDFDGKKMINEIYDVTSQYYINDLVAGMKAFIDYGKAEQLVKYLDRVSAQTGKDYENDRRLVECIQGVANAIQICDSVQMDKALQTLAEEIHAGKPYDNSYFNILVKEIEKDYGVLLKEDKTVIDSIEWCTRKGFTQQALTYIEDKVPGFFCEKVIKMSNNDKDFVRDLRGAKTYETDFYRVMFYSAPESFLKERRRKLQLELLCNIVESLEKNKNNPKLLKEYLDECDGGSMDKLGEADTLPKFKARYLQKEYMIGTVGGWEKIYRQVLESVVGYMIEHKTDKKNNVKKYNQSMYANVMNSLKAKRTGGNVYSYSNIPYTPDDYNSLLTELRKKLDDAGRKDSGMSDSEFIDAYIKYRCYAAEYENNDEAKEKDFWRSYMQLCGIKDKLKPELVPKAFYRNDSLCYIGESSFKIKQNSAKKPCDHEVQLEKISKADIKEIHAFIKLQEALKYERNNANHASEKGNRLSLKSINRAIELFVKIARDLIADEPENRYADCIETDLDEVYSQQK